MLTKPVALTKRAIRRIRSLVPVKPPSLEFSPETWDEQYAARQWDYMEGLSEVARYGAVAAYVRFFNRNSRILEIGCGVGTLLKHIDSRDFELYTGVDISAKAIESASRMENERVRFTACDAARFVSEVNYDLIVFNEALYYFDDCIQVLEHYGSQMRSGGRFIVSMVVGPQSIAHWKRIEARYTIEAAVQTTNNAGITWNCRVLPVTTDNPSRSYA